MTAAPDYAELCAWLRGVYVNESMRKLSLQAADAIEALAARVAELEKLCGDLETARVLWERESDTLRYRLGKARARLAAIEAERDAIVKELDETREKHLREARAADEARDDFEGLRADAREARELLGKTLDTLNEAGDWLPPCSVRVLVSDAINAICNARARWSGGDRPGEAK